MHIFFSGIGGSGIGPLALIAKQAGYDVSGSDQQESAYTEHMRKLGIQLYIGQTQQKIAGEHARNPIDWFVYSSAISHEPSHPELDFVKKAGIRHSLRDELLNKIITDTGLKLIGIAGTHGKSTTTGMVVWLFYKLGVPIGHSVGAKMPFAPMGQLQPGSEYFVYECDEFDFNFLAFRPYLAAITGIAWDHHELFPTRASYRDAFAKFIAQSQQAIMWNDDLQQLGLEPRRQIMALDEHDPHIKTIKLPGRYNRQDAWQAVAVVHKITGVPIAQLIQYVNEFPGLKQRMEQIAPNLYTNYAHTPEKLKGGMLAALEIAKANNQGVTVIYEPLTNRRQHYIKNDYKDVFAGASRVYWVPTYLAREDPNLPVLTPQQLISHLDDPTLAEPAALDQKLLDTIHATLNWGDMVVAMGASGAGSLDEWLRKHFSQEKS